MSGDVLVVVIAFAGGLFLGWLTLSRPYKSPDAPRLDARDHLESAHLSEIAFLRAELRRQQEAHELREAEIRSQLVALANTNALAMSSYYGPERPSPSGTAGVRRVLVPPGGPRPPAVDENAPPGVPWQNSLYGDDHVDLGPDFRDDVPSTTAPAESDAEEALEEATIAAAVRNREQERLAAARGGAGVED